jgi:hypothetical protein
MTRKYRAFSMRQGNKYMYQKIFPHGYFIQVANTIKGAKLTAQN